MVLPVRDRNQGSRVLKQLDESLSKGSSPCNFKIIFILDSARGSTSWGEGQRKKRDNPNPLSVGPHAGLCPMTLGS